MNKIELELCLANLTHKEYEELVTKICKLLFGISTYGFTEGADGGKDGVFKGTAKNFPNELFPWSGKIVIQAKHSSLPWLKVSESKFFNPDSPNAILSKEVKKLSRCVTEEGATHYFLATNRRMTGTKDPEIIRFIFQHSGISEFNIHIFNSLQTIDFLQDHSELLNSVEDSIELLRFNGEDLKEILDAMKQVVKGDSFPLLPNIVRVDYKQKNKANGISKQVADTLLKWNLKYSHKIDDFLKDPRNLNSGLVENTIHFLKN